MYEKLEKKTEESINKILNDGITATNLDNLYKLTKINCMAKKGEDDMNYNNYGRGNYGHDYYGREQYGDYDGYGARRRDSRGRYRGHDYMDRVYDEYGRYEENRSRYGAGNESNEAYRYMTESLKDFTKYLFETAETPQQKQMLREALQSSMM